MKKNHYLLLLTLLLSFPTFSQQKMNLESKSLFEQAGYDKQEIQNRLLSDYKQIFSGVNANEALYFECGQNKYGPLAYILDIHNNDVRSEGMSYGMMITVQMNDKVSFDAIWNWTKTHMYQANKHHPAFGYFGWSLNKDGSFNDEMPAPDGEEYFATALYFADKRWGSGKDIYNYKKEADLLTKRMINRKPISSVIRGRHVTGLSLFDEKEFMVRFTTDNDNAFHTDASYHLPAFYEVWAKLGPKRNKYFWNRASAVSRQYFEKSAHPITGLTPDYGNYDGSPWSANWRPESSTFSYDAWRTVMNWSIDWHFWRKDTLAIERSNRLLTFFLNEGIDNYVNLYTLDGNKLSKSVSTGLIACNATAALSADIDKRLDFVKAFWNTNLPTGEYRYYDGLLYMLAFLHCSNNFKLYL